ncbi:hypothetical protein bsdcttw_47390 [Anaerocolumna chitinilytica]|uniref:Uncharacterized protein n=1 Tax=Anaerocolumna chitinilytica TaxID=1727145 RepID=A0A7M3SAT1_9FIRM|nr:hypothetical protein bsdcttw_47390 [Anaerocolumna chitinilytica]
MESEALKARIPKKYYGGSNEKRRKVVRASIGIRNTFNLCGSSSRQSTGGQA